MGYQHRLDRKESRRRPSGWGLSATSRSQATEAESAERKIARYTGPNEPKERSGSRDGYRQTNAMVVRAAIERRVVSVSLREKKLMTSVRRLRCASVTPMRSGVSRAHGLS